MPLPARLKDVNPSFKAQKQTHLLHEIDKRYSHHPIIAFLTRIAYFESNGGVGFAYVYLTTVPGGPEERLTVLNVALARISQ